MLKSYVSVERRDVEKQVSVACKEKKRHAKIIMFLSQVSFYKKKCKDDLTQEEMIYVSGLKKIYHITTIIFEMFLLYKIRRGYKMNLISVLN